MTKKQEQAAEAATTPEITGETEAKIEHKTPCVYCGPSVRGVARQYTVYASGNTPAALDEFVKQHPAAKNLLVPVERFAQTRKALETAGTAESILYNKIFKSITFDNGTEFAAAEGLERSCVNKCLPRTKVYFCHPYSSWERGTNENTNGMIRRRFPKGTNFAAVTNAQIAQTENWINNYPRKILGYKSSEIVFRECLRELGIAA